MKSVLLFLAMVPFLCKAQSDEKALPVDSATGKITYTEVVQVDSANADALFSRAKLAISKLFNSSSAVTDLSDQESKQIVAKGLVRPVVSDGMMKRDMGEVDFVCTIQCRDGRYKYTFTDFAQKSNAWPNTLGELEQKKVPKITAATWQRIKDFTNDKIVKAISDLKKIMSNSASSNGDNW